jgi:peptidoglycan-N-acetylglucosamine deacetylase
MNWKKAIRIFVIVAGVVLFGAYVLFQMSKSRTFQLFGEIVSHVNTEEKVIALTFDDGPTEYTRDALETLKKRDVKATFFVMGSELKKNSQIGKEIVLAGHELGNHTYSHARMVLKTPSFISEEIQRTDELIREAGYQGGIHFRPPYGKKLFALPWYLMQHKIKTIMWDVEPDSFETSTEFLVQYTLEHTKPGSIILLHPSCESCSGQREAIGKIIDELQGRGYQFVTVSELLTYEKR